MGYFFVALGLVDIYEKYPIFTGPCLLYSFSNFGYISN